ncbi:MAG: hypothetical protein ACE5GU_13450 [Candidatus Scalinduaceae bacterium]
MISQYIRTSGAVLSTGADIKVNVGVKPAFVKLFNSANVCEMEWMSSMPAGRAIRRSGNSNPAYITSSGISHIDDGTNIGFNIGPDSQMNPSGSNEIFWLILAGNNIR